MDLVIQPGYLGFSLIFLVFIYTVYLIRSNLLSAHMAISWVITELVFMVVMMSDTLRASLRSFLGEQNAPYSLFLLSAVWIVFLMLEGLTRVSSLTVKLKEVNQELALTQERLDRAEKKIAYESNSRVALNSVPEA